MRGCLLSLGCIALLVAFAACGTGIAAGIHHALHSGTDRLLAIMPFDAYALEGELHRCRDLGVAAYHDIRCEVAWREDRARLEGCPLPNPSQVREH